MRQVRHDILKGLLDRSADFVKLQGSKGQQATVPARPPNDVVSDILSQKTLPLPPLREIVAAPLVLADGQFLRVPGYDRDSGYLLDLRGLDGVRDDMPTNDAAALLRELVADFPFIDDASRAHAVGMFIQPIRASDRLRPHPALPAGGAHRRHGKRPAAVAGIMAEGTAPAVMALNRDDDEVDKRVTALLLQGARIILLDNVTELRSPKLAAVLTTTTWRGRLLGRSEMPILPNSALWLATATTSSSRRRWAVVWSGSDSTPALSGPGGAIRISAPAARLGRMSTARDW